MPLHLRIGHAEIEKAEIVPERLHDHPDRVQLDAERPDDERRQHDNDQPVDTGAQIIRRDVAQQTKHGRHSNARNAATGSASGRVCRSSTWEGKAERSSDITRAFGGARITASTPTRAASDPSRIRSARSDNRSAYKRRTMKRSPCRSMNPFLPRKPSVAADARSGTIRISLSSPPTGDIRERHFAL